jgi:hypothetical protein
MFSFKMPLTAALLVTAFTIASPGNSFANDADFTLKNKTGYQIDEVYVSAASSKSWGRDIMGTGSLAEDSSVKITFPHGNGACMFDIKVKYNIDNTTAEWSNVNLCETDAISLYWDAKNQVSRAVTE